MNLYLEVTILDCVDVDSYDRFSFKIAKNSTPKADAVKKRLQSYAQKYDPSIKLDASDLEWNEDNNGYWGLYFYRRIFISLPVNVEEIDLTDIINLDYEKFFPCEIDCYYSHRIVRHLPPNVLVKGMFAIDEGELIIQHVK